MHSRNALFACLTATAVSLASILGLGSILGTRRGCTNAVSIESRVASDIVTIESACDDYATHHDGAYPGDLEQLVEPDAAGRRNLRATTMPLDPWRRPYLYAPTDVHGRPPRIGTLGRDGVPGGDGADRDVDNRMLRADFDAP